MDNVIIHDVLAFRVIDEGENNYSIIIEEDDKKNIVIDPSGKGPWSLISPGPGVKKIRVKI